MTGFGKTGYVCTIIEIHFIAYCNSHTQALSRHSDTIAIIRSAFTDAFSNPIKLRKTNTDPVKPLGGINRGPVVPHCSTRCLLSLWYGQGCCGHLSGPLYTQLGQLCLLASLTTPPTPSTPSPPPPPHPHLICGICDIAGCVQNVTQNQPVHTVVI